MNPDDFMGLVLRATEDTIDMLEQTLLRQHPNIKPDLDHADPAVRTLLFAADALSFAIARYRCENELMHRGDPVPLAPRSRP